MENTGNQTGVPVQAPAGKGQFKTGYEKFKAVAGKIVMILYHLRKVVMAAPVVYYALKLAMYNSAHLPEAVGINLQPNGEFAMEITRQMAVIGPLGLTGLCLALMFLSRKAMYSWAISIFTLILPLVILISNQYPS